VIQMINKLLILCLSLSFIQACTSEESFSASSSTVVDKNSNHHEEQPLVLSNPMPIQLPTALKNDGTLTWEQRAELIYQNYSMAQAANQGYDLSHDDCANCGRETGFLPPPELQWISFYDLEGKNSTMIDISWDSVEEADDYELSLITVSSENQASNLYQWIVDDTHVELPLELGYFYIIFAKSLNHDQNLESKLSKPVLIDCMVDECRLLISTAR